jgi:hypothetical protein
MCHHHRSRCGYGYGYGHHGYGHTHHRGGPITALVSLAVPLLTQRSAPNNEKQLDQEPYQPYQPQTNTREYLAPQTTGHTVAPTSTPPLPVPATNEPRGPPPAYTDEKAPVPTDDLEKDMSDMYITERAASVSAPRAPAYPAVGARDYQPLSRTQPPPPPQPTPGEIVSTILDPSSRWAARLQRKEEKARAKLARKAEKYARRERRDVERGY